MSIERVPLQGLSIQQLHKEGLYAVGTSAAELRANPMRRKRALEIEHEFDQPERRQQLISLGKSIFGTEYASSVAQKHAKIETLRDLTLQLKTDLPAEERQAIREQRTALFVPISTDSLAERSLVAAVKEIDRSRAHILNAIALDLQNEHGNTKANWKVATLAMIASDPVLEQRFLLEFEGNLETAFYESVYELLSLQTTTIAKKLALPQTETLTIEETEFLSTIAPNAKDTKAQTEALQTFGGENGILLQWANREAMQISGTLTLTSIPEDVDILQLSARIAAENPASTGTIEQQIPVPQAPASVPLSDADQQLLKQLEEEAVQVAEQQANTESGENRPEENAQKAISSEKEAELQSRAKGFANIAASNSDLLHGETLTSPQIKSYFGKNVDDAKLRDWVRKNREYQFTASEIIELMVESTFWGSNSDKREIKKRAKAEFQMQQVKAIVDRVLENFLVTLIGVDPRKVEFSSVESLPSRKELERDKKYAEAFIDFLPAFKESSLPAEQLQSFFEKNRVANKFHHVSKSELLRLPHADRGYPLTEILYFLYKKIVQMDFIPGNLETAIRKEIASAVKDGSKKTEEVVEDLKSHSEELRALIAKKMKGSKR